MTRTNEEAVRTRCFVPLLREGWALLAVILFLTAKAHAETNASEKVTLEIAIARAMAQNRNLAQAARSIRSSEESVRGAQAGYAIRLQPNSNLGASKAGGSWQYGLSAVKEFTTGTELSLGGRYGALPAQDTLGSEDSIYHDSVNIGLSQPLFRNFGTLVNAEPLVNARQSVRTARRRYEASRAQLVLDVVETFQRIHQLNKLIDVDTAFLSRANRLFHLTKARARSGLAEHVDVLRGQVQSGDAEARLAASRERLSFENGNLAELMGMPTDTKLDLAPPPDFEPDIPTPLVAAQIAISNRMDYAQAVQNDVDTRRGLRIADRGLLPDINFVANFSKFGEGTDQSAAASLPRDDWFVGLVMGSSYNAAQQRSTLARARIATEGTADSIESIALTIAREVQQALALYARSRTEVTIALRNEQNARARAALARRLYDLQRGDHFSVADAEDKLTEQTVTLYNARNAAAVNGYRLRFVMGTLVDFPDELKSSASNEKQE